MFILLNRLPILNATCTLLSIGDTIGEPDLQLGKYIILNRPLVLDATNSLLSIIGSTSVAEPFYS